MVKRSTRFVMRTAAFSLFVCAPASASDGQTSSSGRFSDPHFLGPFLIVSAFILAALYVMKQLSAAAERQIQNIDTLGNAVQDESAAIPDEQNLAHAHQSFIGSCVALPSGQLRSTLPANHFFRMDAVLAETKWGRISFTMYQQVSGSVTGAGILGTFIGISLGLFALPSDGAEITHAIGEVIAGLSSAFVTSILGVAFSLLISWWGQSQENRLQDGLEHLCEALERRYPRITLEKWLSGQNESLTERAEAAQSALDDIHDETRKSREALQQVGEDIADKLGQKIEDSLARVLGDRLVEINQIVKQQMQQNTESAAGEAKRFADEMVQKLAGTLQDSFVAMSTQVNQAGARFDEMASSVSAIVESTQSTVREQRAVLQESAETVRLAQERSRAAEEQLTGAKELMGSITELSAMLREQQQGAGTLLNSQADLQRNTQAQVEQIATQIAAASAAYSQTASQLQNVLSQFLAGVTLLAQRVQSLSEATERAETNVTKTATTLVERAKAEDALLSGYKEASAALLETFRQSRPGMDGILQLAQNMAAQAGELEKGIALFRERESLAGEATAAMREGLMTAQTALSAAAKEMLGTVKATEDWSSTTTLAIEEFGKGIRGALEGTVREYDEALSVAVRSLSASMKDLQEIADEIAEQSTRRSA